MSGRWGLICLAVAAAAGAAGCSKARPPDTAPPAAVSAEPDPYRDAGRFRNDVRTNAEVAAGVLDVSLPDSQGNSVDLRQYRGKQSVVLVVMRGYPGFICPNCSAQTSRLVSNRGEFEKRNAQILVLFPGPTDHLGEFVAKARPPGGPPELPFPVLLDPQFELVDRLGIRGDLAKPSTYILDANGQVRFAYVGATTADRPSVRAMLQQLDAIAKGEAG